MCWCVRRTLACSLSLALGCLAAASGRETAAIVHYHVILLGNMTSPSRQTPREYCCSAAVYTLGCCAYLKTTTFPEARLDWNRNFVFFGQITAKCVEVRGPRPPPIVVLGLKGDDKLCFNLSFSCAPPLALSLSQSSPTPSTKRLSHLSWTCLQRRAHKSSQPCYTYWKVPPTQKIYFVYGTQPLAASTSMPLCLLTNGLASIEGT